MLAHEGWDDQEKLEQLAELMEGFRRRAAAGSVGMQDGANGVASATSATDYMDAKDILHEASNGSV